ncbi:pilus assembly protein CpaB [Blastococcus haudaquaticus]|uniref:Pilus assembly protein CpaB n=2 Tax=Blastococcus haudaquaticus TaxID=1938745 RepID=A0A286H6H7_9ACTN|nr:pilus assembly protein CpaB [Blastococcus haudaquaticus]
MLVAGVLALTGALLLVDYVGDADERAQAAERAVPTLVVQREIAQGTPAGQLSAMVSVVDVPARLVAPDAVTDLTELDGLVAKATLFPGEQVLTGRFAVAGAENTAPKQDGKEQVSITLDAQRAVGGSLGEGDTVAVYVTTPNAEGVLATTRIVDRDVTITRVDGGRTSLGTDSSGSLGETLGATVTVTLALLPGEVPDVVAGMEAQTVWLSLTGSVADDTITTTSGDTK